MRLFLRRGNFHFIIKMRLVSSILIITLIDLILIKSSLEQQPDAPIVTTSTGDVVGNLRVSFGVQIRNYGGIPYAKPPVGYLRFEPPEPAEPWEGVLYAYREGSSCVQGNPATGSEDCLTINVQVPDSVGPDERCPVLVSIHGGGFIKGNGSDEPYGPTFFFSQGCIIYVAFNYRLGAFGFLSTGDTVLPGNNGLKDMILALEWVQTNIAAFNGDPTQVTLMGRGAGAAAVTYLIQSPLAAGLFHRAISISGTALSPWAYTKNPKSIVQQLAASLLIDQSSSASMVSGLKQVDYEQLQQKAYQIQDANYNADILNWYTFSPTIEPNHPGAVLSAETHSLLLDHQFNNVPYLIGFTSKEFDCALDDQNYYSELFPQLLLLDTLPIRMIPQDMNPSLSLLDAVTVPANLRLVYFPSIQSVTLSKRQFEWFVSDALFVKPILETARIYSEVNPVYLFQFSYMGDTGFPAGQQRQSCSEGVQYSEIYRYLFDTDDVDRDAPTADIVTRMRMLKMWYNFITEGDPTPVPDVLLENIVWEVTKTDPNDQNLSYLDIDSDLTMKENPRSSYMTKWYQLYDNYGNPPYITF